MFYCTYTQILPLNTEHKYVLTLDSDFLKNVKINGQMEENGQMTLRM